METTEIRYNLGLNGDENAYEVFDAIRKAKMPQDVKDELLLLEDMVTAGYRVSEGMYEVCFYQLDFYAQHVNVDFLKPKLTKQMQKADAEYPTAGLPPGRLVTFMENNPWGRFQYRGVKIESCRR